MVVCVGIAVDELVGVPVAGVELGGPDLDRRRIQQPLFNDEPLQRTQPLLVIGRP